MADHIPASHPRHASLVQRERLVQALDAGWLAKQGLIAHGRGECYDYLLGETTTKPAADAIQAAAATLVRAQRPVISVNGNAAALAPEALVDLAQATDAPIEVNVFHRTGDRIPRIIDHLEAHGAVGVLGADPDASIPGLESARGQCHSDGIFAADAVLVPLEDGDRCEALRAMGKTVIVVDLNPISRTARMADITIVDNLVRAAPALVDAVRSATEASDKSLQDTIDAYDNPGTLGASLRLLRQRLDDLAARFGSGSTDLDTGPT